MRRGFGAQHREEMANVTQLLYQTGSNHSGLSDRKGESGGTDDKEVRPQFWLQRSKQKT
jgi:hypothetical protein